MRDIKNKRPIIIALFVLGFLVLSGTVFSLVHRRDHSSKAMQPTVLRSTATQSLAEKCHVLERRAAFHLRSPVDDVAYQLTIHEGGWGPSMVISSVAVRVESRYLDEWLRGYEHTDGCPDAERHFRAFTLPWPVKSQPEYYRNQFRQEIILHRKEGIVLLYDND